MAHMSVWLQLTKLQISLDVALIHFLFDLTLMFISKVFPFFSFFFLGYLHNDIMVGYHQRSLYYVILEIKALGLILLFATATK